MSQNLPNKGKQDVFPYASEEFARMHAQRLAEGLASYGRPLQTFNDRDPIKDLKEELIDAWNYACQIEMERAASETTAFTVKMKDLDMYRHMQISVKVVFQRTVRGKLAGSLVYLVGLLVRWLTGCAFEYEDLSEWQDEYEQFRCGTKEGD